MPRRIWDIREYVFKLVFLLYSVPFILSTMRSGLLDFLWDEWHWSIGYYIVGEIVLISTMIILDITSFFGSERRQTGED